MSSNSTDAPPREALRPIRDDEVAAFWRDGVVCLRGVVPEDWLARMEAPIESELRGARTADLTEMARSIERSGGSALADARLPADRPRGRFFAGTDHWRGSEDFRAFASDSPLPEIAARLLRSQSVNLYEDSLLVKEPGTAEPTAWHQDMGYFHLEGEQVCTFWCPLDAAGPENGAVEYVLGSHLAGTIYRPNLFVSNADIAGSEGAVVPDIDAARDRYEILGFETVPGDLVVHHARTLHGAPGNRSAQLRRRAISVRYCGDDARVHLRRGAPRKPHQDGLRDGTRPGGVDCPRVWPPV